MSTPDDRRSSKTSRRITEELAAVERRNQLLEFQMTRMRNSLAAMKEIWWSRRLEAAQVPEDRRCGTRLNEDFEKGTTPMLKPKDLKRARRMAKSTGQPIEVCLKALGEVDRLNTTRRLPSYMGGDVLRKAGGLSAKEQEAVNFALTHKMDGKDRETDLAVFKALYGASISTNRRPGQRIVGSTLDLLSGGR
jgi:hypothetical protein